MTVHTATHAHDLTRAERDAIGEHLLNAQNVLRYAEEALTGDTDADRRTLNLMEAGLCALCTEDEITEFRFVMASMSLLISESATESLETARTTGLGAVVQRMITRLNSR